VAGAVNQVACGWGGEPGGMWLETVNQEACGWRGGARDQVARD
jgi:hypothetical protein